MAHEVGAMADQLVITSEPRVAAPLRVPRQVSPRRSPPIQPTPLPEGIRGDGSEPLGPAVLAAVGSLLATAPKGGLSRLSDAPAPDARPTLDELRARRVAALSYELRSTLALISGYSQALLHLPLGDESRRQYLEQIPIAASNLADLVNEILGATDEREDRRPEPIRPIALPKVRSR